MDTPSGDRSIHIHETHKKPYEFNIFENYWDIIFGGLFALLAFISHYSGNIYLTTIFSALAIASLSVTVSEIAEILAEKLQEPYGSFVLTFSAVAVEILLLYMILMEAKGGNMEQIMDTVKSGIISAVIVDLNVLLGLAVFIGGLSFARQEHNEETSQSYTTILFVTATALLVPSILVQTKHGNDDAEMASIIIAVLLLLFYITIFIFQTKTHSHFFKPTARSRILRYKRKKREEAEEEEEDNFYIFEKLSVPVNLFMIVMTIVFIGFLAELFSKDGSVVFQEIGISAGLAGLIIAIISVAPEIFTAVKAAKNDQIQRVVNIAMGAASASILLTVPILMFLAYLNGIKLLLDFNALQIGALLLTIILVWKTTDDGETNYFEGISHLMFFLCFAVVAFFY